jgi:hypothetical protein
LGALILPCFDLTAFPSITQAHFMKPSFFEMLTKAAKYRDKMKIQIPQGREAETHRKHFQI